MRILVVFSLLFISQLIYCQVLNNCGFDQFQITRYDTIAQNKLDSLWIAEQQINGARAGNIEYTLPIVFHVIHDGNDGYLFPNQVNQTLDLLNKAFMNTDPYVPSNGVCTGIQFCLANKDPDGNFSGGINYVESPLTNLDYLTQDDALKALSIWDPFKYINVWIVNKIESNVAGYSSSPISHGSSFDGIVIEQEGMGIDPSFNAILVHEMGHYLGLLHTFQGGCINNNCLLDGDGICDTPPDNSVMPVSCDAEQNTCNTDVLSGFATDQNDLIENYMDYGELFCFNAFTTGQAERMQLIAGFVRSSLSEEVCAEECPNPPQINVYLASTEIEPNEILSIENNSVDANNFQWIINQEIRSTDENPDFTFTEEGIFQLIVIAFGATENCISYDTFDINVQCSAVAAFDPLIEHCIPIDSVINFKFTGTGDRIEWFADGRSLSTLTEFPMEFQQGEIELMLISYGPICSDTIKTIISVGCERCNNGIDDDGDGLIDLFDDDCYCEPSSVNPNLIPNGDFELNNGCCTDGDLTDCAQNWVNFTVTSDYYYPTCSDVDINYLEDFFGFELNSSMASTIHWSRGSFSTKGEGYGNCLTSPVVKDSIYILKYDLILTDEPSNTYLFGYDFELGVFGLQSCSDVVVYNENPISGPNLCPQDYGWDELHIFNLRDFPFLEWKTFEVEFKALDNYEAIAFIPRCNQPIADDLYYRRVSFTDNFELKKKVISIPATTEINSFPCQEWTQIIVDNPTFAKVQWYKDSIAILGEISDTLKIDHLNGESATYNIRLHNETTCVNLGPFYFDWVQNDTTTLMDAICKGDSIYFNDGYIFENGTYYDTLLNVEGCDSVLRLELVVYSQDSVLTNRLICFGDSVLFINEYIKEAGIYLDSIINSNGCYEIQELTLNIINDTTHQERNICLGDSVFFNNNYYSRGGVYYDTLTSVRANCDSIIKLNLLVNEVIEGPIVEVEICEQTNYLWQGNLYNQTGVYFDTINNAQSCDSVISLMLFINPPLNTIELIDQVESEKGRSITISPIIIGPALASFNWQDDINTVLSNEESLTISVDESQWIYFIANDSIGCQYRDSVFINILVSEQEQIFIPNVFSPNGDNINDYFIPQSNLEISQIGLMVFDRWGNQLFNNNIGNGTDYVNGWNGQSDNKDVPIGVYVYVIDIILVNGENYSLKGDFTILR